jgi:hypothetical protein
VIRWFCFRRIVAVECNPNPQRFAVEVDHCPHFCYDPQGFVKVVASGIPKIASTVATTDARQAISSITTQLIFERAFRSAIRMRVAHCATLSHPYVLLFSLSVDICLQRILQVFLCADQFARLSAIIGAYLMVKISRSKLCGWIILHYPNSFS